MMKYRFSEIELATIKKLNLMFDPTDDLTDDQEMILLESLEERSGFGDEESDAFEDVYTTMAVQYEEMEKHCGKRASKG